MNIANSSTNLRFPKSNLLLKLVDNLKVAYGYEYSFRIYHQALLPNRFLLSINKQSIGEKADDKILDLCAQINMPNNFLVAISENLVGTEFVHLGFEENQTAHLYKVYLEMGMPMNLSDKQNHNHDSPIPLYLGFKWNALKPEQHFITRYLWHKSMTLQNILRQLEEIYQDHSYQEAFAIVKDILEITVNQAGDDCIKYLEVIEDNNQRKSYDLNIYDAQMQVKDLYHVLIKICRYYSIPEKLFVDFYASIKDKQFGHIAGGIHRDGVDFFTIYYGVEGRHG